MNPIAPRIPERLHLFRLSRDVRCVAVLHVATGRAPLKIRIELDAVRWVDVDTLDLAAQAFALGQAGHHLERVAEDHPVRPVLVVLVELRLVYTLGNTVEVREEVRNDLTRLLALLSRATQQVVDQHLGMDLLLDVERRRLDDEVAPVLLILAAPDELRIEIAVAPFVGGTPRFLRLLLDDGLVLRGRDVLALRLLVLEGLDPLAGRWLRFSGHDATAPGDARRRWPSRRPGAPPASPVSQCARAGGARPLHSAIGGSPQDRRAPPEDTGPRAGPGRLGGGIEARHPAVDRAGIPPHGRHDGGGGRAGRDSRAWWGRRGPSDGCDGPGRNERRSRGSGSRGLGGGAPSVSPGGSSGSGHRPRRHGRRGRVASPPGSRRTRCAGTFPRKRARRPLARTGLPRRGPLPDSALPGRPGRCRDGAPSRRAAPEHRLAAGPSWAFPRKRRSRPRSSGAPAGTGFLALRLTLGRAGRRLPARVVREPPSCRHHLDTREVPDSRAGARSRGPRRSGPFVASLERAARRGRRCRFCRRRATALRSRAWPPGSAHVLWRMTAHREQEPAQAGVASPARAQRGRARALRQGRVRRASSTSRRRSGSRYPSRRGRRTRG